MNYKGDKYYIDMILMGEKDVYGVLVDRYRDKVFSLAHKICCNYEDAEEAAQDSFVKAFRSLGSFKFGSSFPTWLYRITYNTSITYVRKKKRSVVSFEDIHEDAAMHERHHSEDDNTFGEERWQQLNLAIQKLSEADRALISMYYYQELRIDEISEITGIGKSNLKIRLFRARKKIEDIIMHHGKEKVYFATI
jgi:RNA polymerase sigma factor (sigma-70 family)